MGAPVRVETRSMFDVLVLTCRGRYCTEQWEPAPIQGPGDGVVQLSMERCPACGSSAWEVTQVQVASHLAGPQRRPAGRRHRSSRSGAGR